MVSSSFPSGSKGFRLSVSANVPGFDWKYYANGLIEYTTSRASEIQTAQGGNPYTLSQKVSTQLYPVLNTVFAHSEIYLQKWGLYLTLFPGQKQPWISVSATDTMSGTTNAKSTLFSVALSDPFVYLDTILKGSTGEKFIRNSTVSGHTDRLYQGKLNLPKVASALPGLEAGLVNILNLTGGTGPTTMKLWVAPDGKVDQLQMSQNNHIPFVATIAFVGPGTGNQGTNHAPQTPPPASASIGLMTAINQVAPPSSTTPPSQSSGTQGSQTTAPSASKPASTTSTTESASEAASEPNGETGETTTTAGPGGAPATGSTGTTAAP